MSNSAQRFYDRNANTDMARSLDKRKESEIFHMRNFNNFIKSLLIGEYADKLRACKNVKVLDLCSGKGGDIKKFQNARFGHVYFVDISEDSIKCCQDRMKNVREFTATYLHADVTRVNIVDELSIEGSIDLVSCQFALHYAFQSEAQCHLVVSNIARALKPGGYFIATLPNAYEIVRRIKSSKENEQGKFVTKNDIYSVTMDGHVVLDNFPLFEAEYDFWLTEAVNCPEYLVYPPLLEAVCKQYGLLVDLPMTTFPDYARSQYNSEDRTVRQNSQDLMQRMKASRVFYGSRPDRSPVRIPREYDHIRQSMSTTQSDRDAYGTLSKDELQVIELYSVVAFQKTAGLLSI